ncbi:hypothetical protein JAAARDRAFT_59800 [Jaapia argillacea MUCL 33604]|uniref:Histone chaperone domain-containing protein n=1 Tax=Jaapia argillacea MUCL 33604 TaxID=933084 RepID=A0A067PLX2_9AGAM|nr:hypothetical protein JAAARDRAFT_59800 [Jaapia argillacea MUCL 33604]
MSTGVTSPSNAASTDASVTTSPSAGKGKGKGKPVQHDGDMDDEDDEDDEEEEDEEDEDDEMEEDKLEEIDPSAILAPGARRTRGVRIDYSSAEALAKAGLKPEHLAADDDEEETFEAKDEEMKDD